MAYESSQARGPIGATAAGLYHSHSNMGILNPLSRGQASTPQPHGSYGFISAAPGQELYQFIFNKHTECIYYLRSCLFFAFFVLCALSALLLMDGCRVSRAPGPVSPGYLGGSGAQVMLNSAGPPLN